ncbi:zinc finger and SCAN domain-containing protein 2 isoform X2 [Ictalurus furcatus]|uniref:zinc finger and SCAN domain-containing protein 2 isoform X2 n=1 Tax=Ictalurus furcatus TaxID=66913 RepID=UPI00234FB644|nr:zinc finger and SCAN domain-containing protein 2 isoform X2 [Ictalurus furcatus]
MAEPRCFQTQLNSIMEIMSRAVVRQICKIVDSDLASLRLELERALHDNAALGDKMRVLESEVETMRKAGARARRKSCRSVCIQTSEASGNKRNTSTAPRDPQDVSEDMADDDDICFISAGFPGTSDVDTMAPDSPRAAATKLISMDGTVQHVIVSGDDDDDDDDDNEEEDRVEFDQHCMPIEFMEGERGESAAFERPDEVEQGAEQDILTDSERMSGSGGGAGHIFNYFDRFNIHHQPGPGDDSAKTDFTCPECGKTFLRRNGLTLHMKSHQKQNAHACRTCKVVFPQKNLLRTHKCLPPEKTLAKTADMRFRCEMCGKYFHSKANLKVHYAVHTGERPHTCSFCGRGFSQKGNLTTHERIHKGERPYVCTTCGKSFTQKGNLTHHLAIHSKINNRMRNAVEKWQ